MSDYTRVLKGLRHCINLDGLEPNDTRIRCYECPYFTEPTRCAGLLMRDAAAAIEALQTEVKRLEPKRGKWIESEEMEWGIYPFKKKTCSVCDCKIDHTFMLACMDYFDDRDTVFHYCPNCGAKMEVQE